MNWIELNHANQLAELKELSKNKAQIIFKHSTRCGISNMAKNRLERSEQPASADFHFLDLIKYRTLSNKIAEDFSVHHESPQVLLIRNAACIYEESHSGINMDEIKTQLNLN